jgi:transposase-like protein
MIADAVRLYFRFPLSLRLVEGLPLERGIAASDKTLRRWGPPLRSWMKLAVTSINPRPVMILDMRLTPNMIQGVV